MNIKCVCERKSSIDGVWCVMYNSDVILSTFIAKKDAIIIFWQYEGGWQVIKSDDSYIDEKYYSKDGIFGLEAIISDRDRIGFKHFLNAVKGKMKGEGEYLSPKKQVIESAFSFNTSTDSVYYKISCYLSDIEERSETILARIELLDSEESYRYRLASIITNDKNPDGFNLEVDKLFKQNPDREFAVIQFDIAGFKIINQQYGEEFGDELLNYFISTLKLLCDETQLFVRLTADVFMILTPYEKDEDIIELIEKIRSLLLGYKEINYRLVFGINKVLDKSKKLRHYGDGAAFARQSIKNTALKYYAFFEERMKKNANDKKWIEDQMEKALENQEFVMYLQPKYSISLGKIIGAEALVR